MPTLYEICGELQALHDLVTDAETDLGSKEVLDTIHDWFWQNEESLNGKVEGYCKLIKEMQGHAQMQKAEAKRLSEQAKHRENAAKRLSDSLIHYLTVINRKSVDTGLFKVSVRNAGGMAPVVFKPGVNPEDVGMHYQKVTYDFDKTKIRQALLSGTDVDFAYLGEKSTYLSIK